MSTATPQGLLDRGEPLLAYNAAREALERSPGDPALRRLEALALARSGDVGRAHALVEAMHDEGHHDAETRGLLARTHKDLAAAARDPGSRARHLAAAHALYAGAFEDARHDGRPADAYYTGINAATLAVLRGDLAAGRRLAHEVRAACAAAESAGGESDSARYWRLATLGEAALILGDAAAAARHYAAARHEGAGLHGDLATTRRQARLLAAHLGAGAEAALQALAMGPIAVFTGHMIDDGRRAPSRFPAAREAEVARGVRERLAAVGPLALYGSAACGADLLFLEAGRDLGIETHVVLPFPPEAFRRSSVEFAGGDWAMRFERALAAAATVTVTSDHRASGSAAAFEYANLVLTGMGRLRARLLDTGIVAMAAWDPRAEPVAGGAAATVAHWKSAGLPVESIPIAAARDSAPASPPAAAAGPGGFRHEMRSLLFADAVGYSKLDEDQIPRYVAGFLGAIAALNARTRHRFEHVEVAGDGLYMVFGGEHDAAAYALELSALARGFDRAAHGLPATLDLRIALHCGPVHCGIDPITRGPMYTGPHTSRAARIEPITPPGQVYASSAFAAVAAARGVAGIDFRYVGRIPLAKGYGTLGLYHLAG